ncbi:hypothetical protein D1271_22830 [Salmonella enterica]|nr:hypothetical protein [Salmonella enterica]EAS9367109.1 hypothetical protein [Salmonella enterica]EHM5288468.1 hypothetical protein [Salmonella enterica]
MQKQKFPVEQETNHFFKLTIKSKFSALLQKSEDNEPIAKFLLMKQHVTPLKGNPFQRDIII